MAVQDRERGRISESDLLSAELEIGERRKNLLETEYQLLLAEQRASDVLGISGIKNYSFDEFSSTLAGQLEFLETVSTVQQTGLEDNPALRNRYLEAEEAALRERINRIGEAPVFSIGFDLSPRYPETRATPESFSASFSDFFTDGAGVDYSVSLALEIPVYTGGGRKADREADKLQQYIAEKTAEQQALQTADAAEGFTAQVGLLRQKLDLLDATVEYEERLFERELQRQEIGASTGVDVETVRLSVQRRRSEQEDTAAELMFTRLQLAALQGKSLESLLLR